MKIFKNAFPVIFLANIEIIQRPNYTLFPIFEKHYRNNEWWYDNGRLTKMKAMVETFHLW